VAGVATVGTSLTVTVEVAADVVHPLLLVVKVNAPEPVVAVKDGLWLAEVPVVYDPGGPPLHAQEVVT